MSVNSLKKKYKSTIKELGRKPTTKDRIFAYYLDNSTVKLTSKEMEVKERWSACFSLLCQYHSPQQAVKVLMEKYGISESSAYRDVRDSMELFGNVTDSDKQAYRHILFEFAMKIFQLAATKTDLAEMNRALITMVKIKGLDKDDPDIPDFALLQSNTYNISLESSQVQLLQNLLKKGVVDLSQIQNDSSH